MAGTPRTTTGRVLVLGGVAGCCGVLAFALATRAVGLAGRLATARADELVELGVLAAGVLVLWWLTASTGLAATCLAVRAAGRSWRRGEALVHRVAPAVVRRAMVAVVAAGLGAASVTAASAAEVPPTASPTTAATVAADGEPLDLGWVVTDVAPSPSAAVASTAAPTPGPAGTTSTSAAAYSAPATNAPTGPPPSATWTGDTGHQEVGDGAATGLSPRSADEPGGLAVVTSSPTPAATGAPGIVTVVGAAAPDALPVPHVPLWGPVPRVPVEETGATVVVVRGDTLWGIAARHLPAGVSDAQVAAAWPAWYAANTATIGPDPDLLLPGQVLVVPAEVGR